MDDAKSNPHSGAVDAEKTRNSAVATSVQQVIDGDRTYVNTPSTIVRNACPEMTNRLGRYEILEKLGEGGMGAVYRAQDTDTGQEVAIKVLGAGLFANSHALRRFEKEARLLEAAKSPHVANLLDVGSEGQTRYLVMEFVRGGDLRRWLKKQESVDESLALEIIGDLCRALVTAHAKGMVHRDIKPENVLIDESAELLRPTIKLTDFGLARHIDQSESLKLTQTGALLGTPYYMSPEQFTGAHEVSPATDVYAIGATLFELLTGSRPFTSSDAIQLASAHCFEDPPDVRKLSPVVSDATAALVRRMLAKHPGQRPQDASTVLEEILRIQTGDSSQFVVHPLLPDHRTATVVSATYEFSLQSSPTNLWPYVSNTDRVNQAMGLQPVTYETFTDADGRIRKFGQFKLAGMNVRWEEHPFEWVERQRFSVLREFPAGPFVWFMSDVELIPQSDGSTKLLHKVKIEPRGIVGQLIAKFELGAKTRRKLEKLYQRIDRTVGVKASSAVSVDAFQSPPGMKRVQRQRLEQRLDQLLANNISVEIVEAFRNLILNSSEQDLARLRPFAVARRLGLSEQDVVDAFLRATTVGLMTLHWDILCPSCRLASGMKATLREIEQHANCSACQTDFEIEFGSSLELVFQVHPEIRSVDARTYCAGGPGNFPHVVAQVRLNPSERLIVPLTLDTGSYVARGPSLPYAVPIEVDRHEGLRHGQIKCAPGLNRSPIAVLRAGHQNLAVENFFPCEQVIRIEKTLRRNDVLTAAQVTAMPLFQSLFPEQTLSPGLLVEVATANFLAIQLNGLDEAFRELGDANTYTLVQDFQRIVERQMGHRGGVLIDRTAETLLACFTDPVVAVETARQFIPALLKEAPAWKWSLAGALHRGAALVTGDRHEVKYFGTTINRVLKLAQNASNGYLVLTPEILSDPELNSKFMRIDQRIPAPVQTSLTEDSNQTIPFSSPSHDDNMPRIHEGPIQ